MGANVSQSHFAYRKIAGSKRSAVFLPQLVAISSGGCMLLMTVAANRQTFCMPRFSGAALARYFYFAGMALLCLNTLALFNTRLTDIFFLVSCLLAFSDSAFRKQISKQFTPLWTAGLIFFTAGAVYSSVGAPKPIASVIATAKFLFLFGIWLRLGAALFQNAGDMYRLFFLWALSVAISSAGAFVQFAYGDVIPNGVMLNGRPAGFNLHPGQLGLATTVALPLALGMLIAGVNTPAERRIMWIVTALISAGTLLSASLTAKIAMLASLPALLLVKEQRPRTIRILGKWLLLFAVLYGIIFFSGGVTDSDRLRSFASFQARLDTLESAFLRIRESPLTGSGLGWENGTTGAGYVVHNLWILSWYEAGLLGFIGICLLAVSVYLTSRKNIEKAMSPEKLIAAALLASYAAFLVQSLNYPIYYNTVGWISAAMVVLFHAVIREKKPEVGSLHAA